MTRRFSRTLGVIVLALAPAGAVLAEEPATRPAARVTVGSKKFTEGVILGDLAAHLLRRAGYTVAHVRELGGTRILWNGLRAGEIDVYGEYTGTILQELFHDQDLRTDDDVRAALAEHGVGMMAPLGFNNTYAIGMKRARAAELGIRTISDLRAHPDLTFGFSNEFMGRADGWPGLRARYDLPHTDVSGLEHHLAYKAIDSGTVDATDLYSTDAEIRDYDLVILEDDLHHFPTYNAVFVYRLDLAERAPKAIAALKALEGRVSERAIIAMNARAKLDKVPEPRVAADFLDETFGTRTEVADVAPLEQLLRNTRDHLLIVGVSLAAAVLIAVPLGIAAAKVPALGQLILGVVGMIQTVPALALLVFMVPLVGIGGPPAIAAVFLYSLLPIVRNTHAGLTGIAPSVRESAQALGLPRVPRLRLVELPIASGSILAGVKTSAVIIVGMATLGALIGAGGYGQPILTGIRLDEPRLYILQGALPAAALALLVQGLFELLDRLLVPKGLRLKAET